MENKTKQSNLKKVTLYKPARIRSETGKLAKRFLDEANQKSVGKQVVMDELIYESLLLVTPETIKKLQTQSIRAIDRLEHLEKVYHRENRNSTKDDLAAFKMTQGWLSFVEKHSSIDV